MPHWLYILLVVPTVSAFIGWLTNWQAVKMIFWPATRKLGWQGIVYAHADKFATNLGQMAQNELMSADEMAAKLDPDELEKAMLPILDVEAPMLIAAAAENIRPGAWAAVPPPMQAMIVEQVKTRARTIARDLTVELQPRAAQLLDVEALVKGQLSGPNVERLARLTEQIGKREFKFIEYAGGVFGLIIGFAQIAIWESLNQWWLMPIFGLIVGLCTNYLALQMIFRPHHRTKYLGFIPYQGLFPKRQPEIARDYGETTAAEVITPRNILELLMTGKRGEELISELTKVLSQRLDEEWAKVQNLVPVPVSDAQVAEIKALVIARMVELTPELQPKIEAILERQLDIRNTVEKRLAALSKPEFERLLRGVFQEDETTLIVVGGVLGAAVGALQGLLILSGVG